ncbi:hypothetical protein SAMN05216419_100561 [Nitrosomonas cryotolerans]|uniref:Uncharacterized protein n=1 Tax=Nitrosomonas cryotolerans ATCC 49181 TaxID=1131553 RepID=A0A1N6G4M0_9PROT|nr:hypothetical protein [Nitrosomonas cryotolerans]SFP52395.1 hypothetical protein SAMN05216419_100561 [Nitrosomonas cryotolerans]SIO02468.1 hypothetical protein SAMN02743940_0548 [Nitrosomonas cryotolerans ATCC 49181]
MSRLWRDQIQVFFAPERVDLVRSSHGFKPVQAPKMVTRCERHLNAPIWEAPLLQLDQMVRGAAGTEMVITLSNHFIRYVTLPPQPEIATPDEVYTYATFRMREIYADRMNEWMLSVSAWSPDGGAVCAAIAGDLMARLEEMTQRYKIKLNNVESYLASAFDRWHPLFDHKQICFVLIETGRICIVFLVNGVWQGIRNQKILHDVESELLAALDQEAVLSGYKKTVESVYLFAPEHSGLVLPDDCGWRVVPIQTETITVPAHYPAIAVTDEEKAGA